MIRAIAGLLLCFAFTGCGATPPDPEPADSAPAQQPAPPPDDVMQNIEMHLWPSTETPGEGVKPLLSIHADRVTGMGSGSAALTFEGAEAMVPARDPGDLEIHFKASHGSYVEGKRATLRDGVVAKIDNMTIQLEEITWEIVPGSEGGGIATSDRPLIITSPTQQLNASSLRLNTADKTLELRDVTGEFSFFGDAL